jgi:transcriptional regulator with XRE-family HTH domain
MIKTTAAVTDLDSWEAYLASTAAGKKAARRLARETSRFFAAYQKCKDASGLNTIRAVARAAGLNPTIVQAIEKQRVKPQYKIIKALAKAFGVSPEALNR